MVMQITEKNQPRFIRCANLAIYLSTRVQGLGTRPRYQKQGQQKDPRTRDIPRIEGQTPGSRLTISA